MEGEKSEVEQKKDKSIPIGKGYNAGPEYFFFRKCMNQCYANDYLFI